MCLAIASSHSKTNSSLIRANTKLLGFLNTADVALLTHVVLHTARDCTIHSSMHACCILWNHMQCVFLWLWFSSFIGLYTCMADVLWSIRNLTCKVGHVMDFSMHLYRGFCTRVLNFLDTDLAAITVTPPQIILQRVHVKCLIWQ